MKLCIAILCTVLGATACKSKKSEPSSTSEPPSKTMPTGTVEPAGSAHAGGHQGSGSAMAPSAGTGPDCATEFDHAKFADKHMACVECEKHRGMGGAMEADCKTAIARPWK